MQLLGTVAAGIGVLGFVTFFGGAILWIRFDQADLPANEAVAVVPREVLLTTGASFLVPALMLSLAAVFVLLLVRLGLGHVRDAEDHHTDLTGLKGVGRQGRFVAEGAFLLVLLVIEVVWVAPEALTVNVPRALILFLLGFSTLAISWSVLRSTERLLWFGLAVFASVSAFIAGTTYFRTADRPKLEPAALLSERDGPRTGFFVARADDYIYLGRGLGTTGTSGGARLIAIPRADVRNLSIGPLVSPQLIRPRSARLALGLCRRRGREAPPGKEDRQLEPPCSRAQIVSLRGQVRPE
jgi:hypothetical protein